jgi:hypothetical protein
MDSHQSETNSDGAPPTVDGVADDGTAGTRPQRDDAPGPLADIIITLEADPAPAEEHAFEGPFNACRRAMEEGGATPSAELIAEVFAFQIHAHDHQSPSTWGLYFGPMMSGFTASGEPWESPPLSMVTPEMCDYWRRRAMASSHPIMRARYADLLWELPKVLDGAAPDAAMARVAIDSYLAAVETGRYKRPTTAVAKAQRALSVALSLRDQDRVLRARDVLLAVEEALATDDSPGLWGFCFDTFVEPPSKRIPITDATRDRLVAELEARLERFRQGPPDIYHPSPAEAAALRLANFYRRLGKKEDVRRVLLVYGEIVRRMRGEAAPLIAAHCLEQLYDYFKAYELHAEADSLNDLIRQTGEESLAEMKTVSVSKEIPRETIDEYVDAMLAGSPSEVLTRIGAHFIPDKDDLTAQLRDLAKTAPITYLFSHTIKDADGRTIARIGPLESDLEGHVLRHISQSMQLTVPWLR